MDISFGSLIGFVHLQVGDGTSKDIPTGAEVAFTDMVNLPDVRRALPTLRMVEESLICGWLGAKSKVY